MHRNPTVTLPLTGATAVDTASESGDRSPSTPAMATTSRTRGPAVSRTAAGTVQGQDGEDLDGPPYIAESLRGLAVPLASLTADLPMPGSTDPPTSLPWLTPWPPTASRKPLWAVGPIAVTETS